MYQKLWTYPDYCKSNGEENHNYDNEAKEFVVPKEWLETWLRSKGSSLGHFLKEYDWDWTLSIYEDAHSLGLVASERVVPRESEGSLRPYTCKYIVCIDSCYVRDAQVYSGSEEDAAHEDYYLQDCWEDDERHGLFLGVFEADSEEEAVEMAAEEEGYDRFLLIAKQA